MGSKCYQYFDDLLVWEDAHSRCKSLHSTGQLATIENQAENDVVAQLLKESAWIGLNDRWEAGFKFCFAFSASIFQQIKK